MHGKLQIALDDITLDDSLVLLDKICNDVDIVEVGTTFMMNYGMQAVRVIKEKYPELEVLCDSKIMDAGSRSANLAFEAGADYVTVLGVTDDATIKDCVNVAKKYNRKIMIDMICVSDFASRIETLEDIGVDIIAVHTGVDQQANGRTPLDDLKEMRQYIKKSQVAVAGGINLKTISEYMKFQPEVIIVGSGISSAVDPVAAAKEFSIKIKG
ncbi:MAG: 3-hexulose-6-phosphate synthase [Clostridia bacterium]